MSSVNRSEAMISSFSDNAIDEQMLLDNEHCVLVLPQNPVYQYHFMIIPKRKEAHTFTDLGIEELSSIQDLTKRVVDAFRGDQDFHYSGYNLFCNNGSIQANQHVNQFHMHLFLRSTDEEVSPYDLMNQDKRWVNKDTSEWKGHKAKMKAFLGSDVL